MAPIYFCISDTQPSLMLVAGVDPTLFGGNVELISSSLENICPTDVASIPIPEHETTFASLEGHTGKF
jgi:hypothetical protein